MWCKPNSRRRLKTDGGCGQLSACHCLPGSGGTGKAGTVLERRAQSLVTSRASWRKLKGQTPDNVPHVCKPEISPMTTDHTTRYRGDPNKAGAVAWMALISALRGRSRQIFVSAGPAWSKYMFQATQGYIVRPCLKQTSKLTTHGLVAHGYCVCVAGIYPLISPMYNYMCNVKRFMISNFFSYQSQAFLH